MSFREYALAEDVKQIRTNQERWYFGVNKLKLIIIKKILEDEINE